MAIQSRLCELLGIEHPILQAPMGWIARAQLASAVSNAGGLGIIETSSGEIDNVRAEMRAMRDLTDKPWGVNIAQLFVRDPLEVVDLVADEGVRFVTTSAGDPTKLTDLLHERGITVFHVVPSVRGARKAVAAGVDGLIVEGNEGGGFKAATGAATMVLLPAVADAVDVPIVAAGGVCDGRSMAAALLLGADGVQMGTRMVSAAESPIHDNWKQLIVDATETDTLLLNQDRPPAMRAMRTPASEAMMRGEIPASLGDRDAILDLYFNGNLDAAFALGGQVAGRIGSVAPVAEILSTTMRDCERSLRDAPLRLRVQDA